MIELSFVMKKITINLGCYFGHPLYVNVVHSTTLRHQGRGVAKILDESGTGSGSGPKVHRVLFQSMVWSLLPEPETSIFYDSGSSS